MEQRRFFGDWEGDTVEGKVNRGRVATLVERKTLFTVMAKVENRGAESFNTSVLGRFQQSPWLPLRTLTVDNGSEFARHEELTERLGVDVYFARPHCSWQRGLNENTNGIIRQYLPKGTDLRLVSKEAIARVEYLLNNRPRKKLGYRTPFEVMAKRFLHTPIVRIRT